VNPTVLLVGLPGSGATTVGTLLANRLGTAFLDDDVLLERAGGPSRALTLLLAMPGGLVAAVPDEVIDNPGDRERLAAASAHVVWLRCSIPVLARRLAATWGPEAATTLRRLTAERSGCYEQVADQVIDTDAQPAGAVAKMIMSALDPATP
jgi:shikimate kinase